MSKFLILLQCQKPLLHCGGQLINTHTQSAMPDSRRHTYAHSYVCTIWHTLESSLKQCDLFTHSCIGVQFTQRDRHSHTQTPVFTLRFFHFTHTNNLSINPGLIPVSYVLLDECFPKRDSLWFYELVILHFSLIHDWDDTALSPLFHTL